MLNFYYYDSPTGRVLATGSYEERGDGATVRAIGGGLINPATEYAPSGVKTTRPLFPANVALDKQVIVGDTIDGATITNIPAGTVAKVYKDGDALPRSAIVVNDGSLIIRADSAGTYQIVLSNFPMQELTFTVRAT